MTYQKAPEPGVYVDGHKNLLARMLEPKDGFHRQVTILCRPTEPGGPGKKIRLITMPDGRTIEKEEQVWNVQA